MPKFVGFEIDVKEFDKQDDEFSVWILLKGFW